MIAVLSEYPWWLWVLTSSQTFTFSVLPWSHLVSLMFHSFIYHLPCTMHSEYPIRGWPSLRPTDVSPYNFHTIGVSYDRNMLPEHRRQSDSWCPSDMGKALQKNSVLISDHWFSMKRRAWRYRILSRGNRMMRGCVWECTAGKKKKSRRGEQHKGKAKHKTSRTNKTSVHERDTKGFPAYRDSIHLFLLNEWTFYYFPSFTEK